MTFLGKLFVMINVGISLMMAFAAFGLYVNGVDWGYDVARPGTQGGVLKERDAEIKELQPAQYPTEGAWKTARQSLWKAEEERREARAFYVSELERNRSKATPGENPDPDDAARAVAVDDKFRPIPQNAKPNLPQMKKGAEVRGEKGKEDELDLLYSRAFYVKELADLHKKLLVKLDELHKEKDDKGNPLPFDKKGWYAKDMELTREMYDKDTMVGLRTYIDDEREKRKGLEEELRLVRPLYVNTGIEAALSRKRLESLQEQIKGLNAYVKRREMDVELSKR